MCGRIYLSRESQDSMFQSVLEYLDHRNIQFKTGDDFPGDVPAVISNNRKLEPQAFGMEELFNLPNVILIDDRG